MGRFLPFFVTLALVAPSPALTAGIFGLLSPGALAAISVLSLRRSRQLGPERTGLQRRLEFPVIAAVLLAVSSLADPQADSIQRSVARLVSVAAFYSLAMVYSKSTEEDRRQVRRAVLTGAVIAASLAVVASLRSRGFLGADILPSRNFILPVELPKTTGVPRSFGEQGLILAGGLATRLAVADPARRYLATLVILGGFLVGQSRNMLVVLAAVLFVLFIRRYISALSGVAGVFGILALLSPMVATALVSQDAVREQFVGEGIFERNVDARLSLLDEVSELAHRNPIGLRLFGATRAEWGEISEAAPHNHFVSLFVFDGYGGIFYAAVLYLWPILRTGKRPRALHDPEFVWMIGAMVALSFYEGAFSASLAVALALLHSQDGQSERTKTPDVDRAAPALEETPATVLLTTEPRGSLLVRELYGTSHAGSSAREGRRAVKSRSRDGGLSW